MWLLSSSPGKFHRLKIRKTQLSQPGCSQHPSSVKSHHARPHATITSFLALILIHPVRGEEAGLWAGRPDLLTKTHSLGHGTAENRRAFPCLSRANLVWHRISCVTLRNVRRSNYLHSPKQILLLVACLRRKIDPCLQHVIP
jgi:hypothetical protein